MTTQEIKNKILSTKYFIDNEYLDKYCELIVDNLETKREKYKTNKHHILPKCYFRMLGLPIDNSSENLVHILYKDHILIHYYLCLCTEGKFKALLFNGLVHLISKNSSNFKLKDFKDIDLDVYQQLYEEWKKSSSLYLKGKSHGPMKQETKDKISVATTGRSSPNTGKKFSKETCSKISNAKKGCKYSEEARANMSKGRTGINGYKLPPRSEATRQKLSNTLKGRKKSNPSPLKGRPMKQEIKDKISLATTGRPKNFSLEDRLKRSETIRNINTGRKWSKEALEARSEKMRGQKRKEETKQKMSTSRKGKKWFTNGIVDTLSYECPEGFREGRSKKKGVKNENKNTIPSKISK